MGLIPWNDDLAINISEIDEQNKQLVNITNELFDAMMDGRGFDIIDDILNKLIEYTDCHFATEEKYFDQFQFAESEKHKEEHRYYLEQVNELKKALDAGKMIREGSDNVLSIDLWKLLESWLNDHLKNSDKKYAPLFFKKRSQIVYITKC
jgi:hemerythrin-like metal-binding protein